MPQVERTVRISRPVGEVFAFFTDPANDKRWRGHVKEIRAEGPMAVGTVVRQVVAGPFGRGIPADFRVTAFEPDRLFTFDVIAGPVRPHGGFVFAGDGATTTVTFSLAAELSGLKKLVMTGPVQKSMAAEAAAMDRAKTALEA